MSSDSSCDERRPHTSYRVFSEAPASPCLACFAEPCVCGNFYFFFFVSFFLFFCLTKTSGRSGVSKGI